MPCQCQGEVLLDDQRLGYRLDRYTADGLVDHKDYRFAVAGKLKVEHCHRGHVHVLVHFPTNRDIHVTFIICFRTLFNHFTPRPAKTVHFVSLLRLTLYNFTHQGRASGWERVTSNCTYLPISLPLTLSLWVGKG